MPPLYGKYSKSSFKQLRHYFRHKRRARHPVSRIAPRKRAQNMTTEVRWFKRVDTLTSNPAGNIRIVYDQSDLPLLRQWELFAQIWEEFKILKIVVSLVPANIGGESFQTQSATTPIVLFRRGNIVSWIDPNTPTQAVIPNIESVMGRPSARIFQPRRFHKRWMTRPRGYPKWGTIDNNGLVATPDEWVGSINIFGQNFTPPQAPGSQAFFYVTTTMKVVFRSRQDN